MPETATRMRPSAYFGSRAHDYEASAFHLAESTYSGRARLPLHSHSNAHFCLVLSGAYTERLGECEVRRRPGDLIFYGAGVGHAERHHQPGRHFLIEIGPALAALVGQDSSKAVWTSDHGATRTLATRLFAEFRRDRRAPVTQMAGLVERLVEQAGRRAVTEPRQPWLRQVESELRRSPDGTPDLGRLAREAGVHPVYLGRAFRRAYGCTPGEFLRRLRVERAQRALARGVGLAEVAHTCGFCDQSHLNRVFKRHTGLTPGRYRELAAPAT